MLIKQQYCWRRSRKIHAGRPELPPRIVYNENGFPVKPEWYDSDRWNRFIERCDRLIEKSNITYRDIIENRLLPLPPKKYRVKNWLAGRINKQTILKVINKMLAQGHVPKHSIIALELGCGVWCVRKLLDKHNIPRPHTRKLWWLEEYHEKKRLEKKYPSPPPVSGFMTG